MEIFNSAEIIIGLHGAGFANIVFAQKNTKIIELKSKTAGKVIENLANSNNLIYKSIECEPSSFNLDNQYGYISIPLFSLESFEIVMNNIEMYCISLEPTTKNLLKNWDIFL